MTDERAESPDRLAGAGHALEVTVGGALPTRQVEFLENRLDEFNCGATGLAPGEWLGIVLRDDDGQRVAGLCGAIWGGCVEIRQCWVHPACRGRGLGARLLAAAELEARRRDCRQMLLTTFSFQAPGFYARHGFEVIAELHDFPAGHANLVMRKRLDGCRG